MRFQSRQVHGLPLTAAAAGVALTATALSPDPAAAQEQLQEIVVTPTRTPTSIERVGTSVSVIDRRTIEDRQYRTVGEALRSVPGLRMVQQGPRGTATSIFMRGANSNQTLVLLDGQRIADPSTPAGAFDFGGLTTENVQRIEVVRGAQSSLYGSGAIGGVVNIITREAKQDGVRGGIRAEAGTRETIDGSAELRGRSGEVSFAATLSGVDTDGDTVTPARLRPGGAGSEDDGHRQVKGTARLGVDLTERLELSIYGEISDSRTELDTSPEDPNSEGETRRYITNAELAGSFWDGRYRPTVRVSYSDFTRDDTNRPDALSQTETDTRNEGSRAGLSLENELDVHADHTLVFGASVREESFEASGFRDFGGLRQTLQSDADATTAAAYVQDVFQLTERLSGTVGVRFDKPEDFDGQATWHLAPSYTIPATGTRLKASVGTGFKTPSLFQRFGFTPTNTGTAFRGNPNLDAEESFSWEIGVEQRVLDERVRAGVTYFQSDVDDGVVTVFDANFNSTTVNNEDLDIQGVESFLAVTPVPALNVRVDHTYLDAENADTGQRLVRRPRHKLNLEARWQPGARWTLTGGLRAIAGGTDIGFTGGRVDLDDHVVARAAARYRLNDRVALTARVENLTDTDYEVADGFKGPGVEGFVGTRVSF
ncbi:vitamin B12 transporter [Limimonas halophila]|uniref:Vitamin B12 transporter n=1 Tax=Limimonas halophila TaxID=1082479 RepID=A0A1G7M500_9PROT|nr:TonB-dependent receptor [Limimonas halophila]SDF56300.1 vitamin B12 transporter [Limimonas halophila]